MTRCAFSVATILAIAASRVVRAALNVALPGGAVGQQRRGIDVGGHVAQRGLGELEVGQVLAEHLAARGLLQRLVERAAREAQRRRGHRGAEDVQRAHRQLEALAGRAEQAILGDPAAAKRRRASGCGAMTSMRSAISKPGVPASTTKADRPRVPGASPVRANTQ
jgi:hypothetical protein